MARKSLAKRVRENNVNPLFTQWLKEWRDEAASKNSNAKHTYSRALQSLNKFPLMLKSGKDCLILKNFGQKICDLLDKKLEEHRRLHPDFDENVSVPILQPKEKQPKRRPKVRDPPISAEPQPGPSQAHLAAPSEGNSTSRIGIGAKPHSKMTLTAQVRSNLKPSALATLKVNKPLPKIPRVKTAPRKSKGGRSSQQAQVVAEEPKARAPSPPVPYSPQNINLPRFSFDNFDSPPMKNGSGPEPEVIDLSQHVESPQSTADVDSLLTLTERLLAKSSNQNGAHEDAGSKWNCDNDDDDDDCVIVAEEFGSRRDKPLENSPDRHEPRSPLEARSFLEHILNDSSNDVEVKLQETAEPPEDSFMDLLPRRIETPSKMGDSVLDVAAGIREKRKNFLDRLGTQTVQKQPLQPEVQLPSFFSSPDNSVICDRDVSPPRVQNGNAAKTPEVDVPQSSMQNAKDRRGPTVPVEFSEDSDDELLIPLALRLRAEKAPVPPPTPPQSDSFAQLVESFETPTAVRTVPPTKNDDIEVVNPEPTRKRKNTKAVKTTDVEAAPKKRARKNKEKPPPAPTVPVRAFNVRYVPEGSRLPVRSLSSYTSESPSRCPHKVSLKPGTFDIILCVDSCEATGGVNTKKKEAMLQALQTSGVRMEVRKMNVGDFAWIAKSGDQELVLDCIVERKRTDDLASSIKDGRYAEQKHRLITSGIKRKIYLIEEFNRFASGGITDQALLQAQMNTQVISDFIVKQTKNTKESARYLTTLTRALELKYKDLHLRSCLKEEAQMFENHLMTWQEYNEAGYKRKKVCTREMFMRALMVVRGMSLERALTIATVYPTVTALLEAFDGCDEAKQKNKLLADLRCPISGRRIGPALSKVLKQIFVDGHNDHSSS